MDCFFVARADTVRITGRFDALGLARLVAERESVRSGDAAGLVWRYPIERADPVALRYGDRLLVGLSVWTSYADAWRSAYASGRSGIGRSEGAAASRVLWWVAAGETPTPGEAVRRLEHLERYGPGPAAFTLRSPAPPLGGVPPDRPAAERAERGSSALGGVLPVPGLWPAATGMG